MLHVCFLCTLRSPPVQAYREKRENTTTLSLEFRVTPFVKAISSNANDVIVRSGSIHPSATPSVASPSDAPTSSPGPSAEPKSHLLEGRWRLLLQSHHLKAPAGFHLHHQVCCLDRSDQSVHPLSTPTNSDPYLAPSPAWSIEPRTLPSASQSSKPSYLISAPSTASASPIGDPSVPPTATIIASEPRSVV